MNGRSRALWACGRFVEGWLDTYEKGVKRRVARGTGSRLNTDPRYGIGTTEFMRSVGGYAMTLECGQHEDPQSPEVAYRAIRNALAFLRLTDEPAPESVARYEALKLDDVIDRAHPDDRFEREWSSFDRLAKGDVIATRSDGTRLTAPEDGWIVFPDAKANPGTSGTTSRGRTPRSDPLPDPLPRERKISVEEKVGDRDRCDHGCRVGEQSVAHRVARALDATEPK
jgi:hypothetical protein